MKKLLLVSLLGVLGMRETMAQTCGTTVATFPHIQDFEGATTGAPGTLPTGWTMVSNPTTSTYRWQVNAGPTSSTATGPNIDHTLGTAAGKYVYTEASNGSATNETELQTPCFNLTGLTSPGFEFWYHMAGQGMGPMTIDVSTNNGTTWTNLFTFTGPQQATENDPWLKKTISLGAYIGQTVKIRFKGTKITPTAGSDFEGDMAIDDFKIFNIPPIDAELVAITAPAASSGCAFTATENVTISIKNNGNAPLSNIPVRFVLGTTTVNETTPASLSIAPGATGTYTFTAKANLAAAATYTLTGTVLATGDGDPSNDSKTRTITVVPNISTFPYFQNFESGNGGWVASGTNSSWALGTPAKTVINSAGSGTNSWVTNLTGTYNASENSQVAGPCFNFTSISQPIITMKIWWNSEAGWDGAVLQSSINGGNTWQNVGAFGDPNNWYNDNSLDNRPGGSMEGWAGRASSNNGSNGWVTAKHTLTGLGGQSSVLLRIAFGSDGSVQDEGFAFDDVAIFQTPANDVGVVAQTTPVSGACGYTTAENVCITITNFGTAPTTSFPVSYTLNGGTPVTENVTTPIAPGATATYCFTTKANLAAGGVYNFTFTTNMTGDGDPSNNTITRVVNNPLISTFPHVQDFQTAVPGAPGTQPAGWTISPTTGFRFEVEDGQPTSGTTSGPSADHTTGNATTGRYTYTESSSGATGDIAYLISPCINLSGLTTPGFEFWYHMHGATTGSMEAQVSNNGGTTWTTLTTLTGAQQTANTDPWLKRTVSLAGYTGIVQVRFKGTRGSSFTSDMAIDDIRFFNIPANDAEMISITLPNSGCNLTTTENICINVKNNSASPISNVPVNYTINGGTPVSETVPGPIAPGATVNYCFTTKANLSVANTYTIVATVLLPSDGDASNNSKTGTVTTVPSVASLPYTEGFENGNGGWVASGTNSSWAIGTPAKPVINSAGAGTKSYVTNLTGTYNASENSQVLSPCFNFTGVPDPDFEMKIWWNSEAGWDGAVLQSSINGGTTWQNVGALNDPNNWYNDNSLDGRAGGQDIGWAGRASTSNGSNGWVRAKHKLNGLGGQASVRLRIAFGSDGSVQDDGFAFDDIRIGDNTGNLGINSFVPLTQLCGFGTNEKVEVNLENFGSLPASGYTLSYTVNGGAPVTAPTVPTLQPGVPVNFVFPVGANLSAPGNYTIVVTVTNPNDPDASNNTITYTIGNASYTALPPVFNFETAATGVAGLRIVTNSKSAVTEDAAASLPLAGQPATSTKGMIMEGTNATGWVMPVGITDPWTNNPDHFSAAYICFDPQGAANPTTPLWLSFDLKQLYKTANANTNFRVTVNGTQVGPTYRPPFAGTPIDWQKIYVDLSSFKNLANIQVGLESSVAEPFAAGAGTANLIDNVRILRSNPTGVSNEVFQRSVNVYPNPSNGEFSISVPTTKAYTLEVTDLTGRVVKKEVIRNSNTAKLDLKGQAQGVYLLKITSEGASAVQKLVIE